jgi:hypothetical protein
MRESGGGQWWWAETAEASRGEGGCERERRKQNGSRTPPLRCPRPDKFTHVDQWRLAPVPPLPWAESRLGDRLCGRWERDQVPVASVEACFGPLIGGLCRDNGISKFWTLLKLLNSETWWTAVSIGPTSNSQCSSCYNFWNRFKLESSLNFKGVQTLWEKSSLNSLKFYLDLILITLNLVGHTCMQEKEVTLQVSMWLYLK